MVARSTGVTGYVQVDATYQGGTGCQTGVYKCTLSDGGGSAFGYFAAANSTFSFVFNSQINPAATLTVEYEWIA